MESLKTRVARLEIDEGRINRWAGCEKQMWTVPLGSMVGFDQSTSKMFGAASLRIKKEDFTQQMFIMTAAGVQSDPKSFPRPP